MLRNRSFGEAVEAATRGTAVLAVTLVCRASAPARKNGRETDAETPQGRHEGSRIDRQERLKGRLADSLLVDQTERPCVDAHLEAQTDGRWPPSSPCRRPCHNLGDRPNSGEELSDDIVAAPRCRRRGRSSSERRGRLTEL